mgnify:CR=1 FL=1
MNTSRSNFWQALLSRIRFQKSLRRIKLSTLSLWFSALLLMALGANTYFMFKVNEANGNLIATQDHQRQSTALTTALRLEMAQLTQFVRAYALTGDSRYLLYYYDIVAIHMGEKAAPENFDPDVYWDNVVTGRVAHEPLSEKGGISLEARMKALNFTLQELVAFENVQVTLDAMTKIEQVAFAATQGLYDPVESEFVSDGQPHLEFATKLVNSSEYNQRQADLASAIKAMTVMV